MSFEGDRIRCMASLNVALSAAGFAGFGLSYLSVSKVRSLLVQHSDAGVKSALRKLLALLLG